MSVVCRRKRALAVCRELQDGDSIRPNERVRTEAASAWRDFELSVIWVGRQVPFSKNRVPPTNFF